MPQRSERHNKVKVCIVAFVALLVLILVSPGADAANAAPVSSTAEFEIPLATGWNLISLPLIPADPSPAAILAGIAGKYEAVYAYDATSSDPWKVYSPDAPAFANDLVALTVGQGFWVRMRESATLRVSGQQPDYVEIDLQPGWNLIGLPAGESLFVGEAFSAIAGKLISVFGYETFSEDGSAWRVYAAAAQLHLNDLRELHSGRGYWLRVSERAELVAHGKLARTAFLAGADELRRNGQYQEAAADYRQITAAGGAAERREAYYGLALTLMALEDYQGAIGELSAYIAELPPSDGARRAYYLLGVANHRLGNAEEASAWLRKYIDEGGPASTDARVLLADIAAVTDPGQAVAILREALDIDPFTPFRLSIIKRLAGLYERLLEPSTAITWYERLQSEGNASDQALALYKIAELRLSMGDSAGWQQRLMTLVTDYPRSSQALSALQGLLAAGVSVDSFLVGRIYYYFAYNSEAMMALNEYIASNPEGTHIGEAHFYRAVLFERAGAWQEAVDAYEVSYTVAPDGSLADHAAWWRARLLEDLDRSDEAATAYKLVVDRYPGSTWAADAGFRWGLMAYKAGAYGEAISRWLAVAESSGSARAYLWAGKAALADGREESARDYLATALERSPSGYFGLRARLLLSPNSGGTDAGVVQVSPPDWGEVESWLSQRATPGRDPFLDPRWRAGLELQKMGLAAEAAPEWRALISSHSSDPWALYMLIRAFDRLRLTYPAALAALNLNAPGAPPTLLRIAYPTDYLPLVQASAQKYGVSPLLLLALIRQESLFDPAAGSVAGALGLAQVIPPTGQSIANQLGLTDFVVSDLFRPVISIEFGAFYLSQQLGLFDGGVAMALAAYNGGPGNALRWSEDGQVTDPDLFLAAIDFSETNTYVRVVLENYAMYRYLYGGTAQPALPSGQ